ncbi:MAG: RNA methyltransferase [Bdellovibrionota bacterium]
MRIAVGLCHHPIKDQRGNIVATNITNLDIHDIARACRVYGVERYYLIHPLDDQQQFVHRILDHWRVGEGSAFNHMRKTSLTMVHTAPSLEKALEEWGKGSGQEAGPGARKKTKLVSTHPRPVDGVPAVTFRELKAEIDASRARQDVPLDDQPRIFLLFGTGFGLTDEMMRSCDALLEGIRGASVDDYRHLSVRSAVSICLDRLLGPW